MCCFISVYCFVFSFYSGCCVGGVVIFWGAFLVGCCFVWVVLFLVGCYVLGLFCVCVSSFLGAGVVVLVL